MNQPVTDSTTSLPQTDIPTKEQEMQQSDPRTDNAKQNVNEANTQSPTAGGMFSGWGFDVNGLANNVNVNLGGLFTSPDATDVPEPTTESKSTTTSNTEDPIPSVSELQQIANQAARTASKSVEAGWGTLNGFLDNMLAPDSKKKNTEDGTDPAGDNPAVLNQNFHKLFPQLDDEDEVVDHFSCVLLQKYRCYLNNVTPERLFPLAGRMFVTTTHIAMYVSRDDEGLGVDKFGLTVPFEDVAKIQRGAKFMIRIVTKSQASYIFAVFESESHFTSALALLEHMAGASGPQNTSSPEKEKEETTETKVEDNAE